MVEAGQLDVARALVLQSSPREQGGVTGGGQEEHAENKDRARGEVDDDKVGMIPYIPKRDDSWRY